MDISKQTVLIVDDSDFERACLEQILAPQGINVLSASSGEEALKLLYGHNVAVVLLDVNMNGINGFDTARLIRTDPSFEFVPIMFITGTEVSPSDMLEGYGTGAVDYLLKPVNPQWLLGKVRVFCELSEQQRIIESQLLEIKSKNDELEKQLEEITALREIIPICASCKQVRDDKGYWVLLEEYIVNNSDAEFTHSVCPSCAEDLYPDFAKQ